MSNTFAFKNKLKCEHEFQLRQQLLNDTLAVALTNSWKEEQWFHPGIQFVSAQLKPFNLSGNYSFLDREFKLNVERDKQDTERLGYSIGLGFSEQAASINPVVQYDLTDKISCNANLTLSTDDKVQVALGCDYALAKDKKISVNYVENYENRRLQDSMVVLGYVH